MQRSCKELKRIARENLDGKYSAPMLAYTITLSITLIVELTFSLLQTQTIILYIVEFLISVVTIILTCGQYRIHLAIARGQKYSWKDLFYPIKNQPDRYILGQILYLVLMVVAMIPYFVGIVLLSQSSVMLVLLSIPCSILSIILLLFVVLNFEPVFFFMLDDENLSVMEAFKKCRSVMKGNKGRYFYISLSFLGMLLLVTLSLGVTIIWVAPYMTQTITAFYLDVSGQLDAIEEEKKQKKQEQIHTQPPTMFNQYV